MENILAQAKTFHQNKKYNKAISSYKIWLEKNPEDVDVWHYLGRALYEFEQDQESLVALQQALSINDQHVPTLSFLGEVYFQKENLEKALEYFSQVVDLGTFDQNVLLRVGQIFYKKREWEKAKLSFQEVLKSDGKNILALNFLGQTFLETQNLEKAKVHLQEALSSQPNHILSLLNMGKLYLQQDLLDLAETYFKKALELDSKNYDAVLNLALVYFERGEFKSSLSHIDQAIALNSNRAEAHYYRSLFLIKAGHFQMAWREYDWRIQSEKYKSLFQINVPLWNGSSLLNKVILVRWEQGLGDQLFFYRCLEQAVKEARNVYVECDEKLFSLFKRSYPEIAFIKKPFEKDPSTERILEKLDFQIPAATLFSIYKNQPSDFQIPVRKLVPDSRFKGRWERRLYQTGQEAKIGINWKCFPNQEAKVFYRKDMSSFPLKTLMPVFSLPNFKFINLQYGPVQQEIESFTKETGMKLHDWNDFDKTNQLDEVAAVIDQLDCVISNNSAVAYLAASLGKPTFVLVDKFWGNDFEPFSDDIVYKSLWFSNLEYIRQSENGDWTTAVEKLVELLG